MTDNERYYTAKIYMDKLANGMNPLTGEDLPEDTVLNNVYLCRAFSLAASVLDEAIKNGCRVQPFEKSKMLPFQIDQEQKSKIRISESPVTVTAITNRIEKVLDKDIKPLAPVKITQWLEMQGFLESKFNEEAGERSRVATEEGERLGIESRSEMLRGQMRYRTFYNINAQAFIIANLEKIAEETSQSFVFADGIEEEVKLEEEEKPKKTTKKSKAKK
ncbi:MAG: hypothetical protein MJ143_04100 [Clostridia bacterium]|nr:hypothetical protein [Clostridia bacterium]